MDKIAFIGFGEAAGAIVKGWNDPSLDIRAFDIKTDDPALVNSKYAEYEALGVRGCETLAEALIDADQVLSAVTASQSSLVVQQAAGYLKQGALFFDLNSCAPQTKQASAKVIDAAGGRYIDTAVMTPIYPKMHKADTTLSGPHAVDGVAWFNKMDMNPTLLDGDVGAASMIKMVRSIMIKGIEALALEFTTTAVAAGVDRKVLNALGSHFPGMDWQVMSAYLMERVATHGIRRAEEMEEVCKTIEGLGLEPVTTTATVARQRQIGELKLAPPGNPGDYKAWAEKINGALSGES